MKIVCTQNAVGNYNFLDSSEKNFSFYLVIKDEDNKTIEEDGVKAILHFYGDPDDKYNFQNWENDIYNTIELCVDYLKRNYNSKEIKKSLLFLKIFNKNKEELLINLKHNVLNKINAKIACLQEDILKVEKNYNIDNNDIDYLSSTFFDTINDKIKYWEKYSYKFKEDTEEYKRYKEYESQYTKELEEYLSFYNSKNS